jgi:hypothetical protein
MCGNRVHTGVKSNGVWYFYYFLIRYKIYKRKSIIETKHLLKNMFRNLEIVKIVKIERISINL